jgi:hypothetical protein
MRDLLFAGVTVLFFAVAAAYIAACRALNHGEGR